MRCHCPLERDENSTHTQSSLFITDMQDLADIVRMHEIRPEHGLGNLRIRHGNLRDKDLLLLQSLLVEYVEPKPINARALTTGYQFKVRFTTLKFNGITGEHRQPEGCVLIRDEKTSAIKRDTRLSDEVRDKAVEWCKLLVRDPYATGAAFKSWRVKRHGLAAKWALLPRGRWMLTNSEARPSHGSA